MTATKTGTKKEARKKQAEARKAGVKKDLTKLATQIRDRHRACLGSVRTSIDHAIKAGELLTEARKSFSRGEWLPWLKEHCRLHERVAQNYMRVARLQRRIKRQLDKQPTLTLKQALCLVGSKSVKKQPGRDGTGVFRLKGNVAARKARKLKSLDRGLRSSIVADKKVGEFLAARRKMIFDSVRLQAVKLAKSLPGRGGPDGVLQVAFTLVSRLKEMLDVAGLFLTDGPASATAGAEEAPFRKSA